MQTVVQTSVIEARTPASEPRPPSKWRRVLFEWGLVLLIPLLIVGVVGYAASISPAFYTRRLDAMEPAQRETLAKRFVRSGSRLINDVQYSDRWKAKFGEAMINAWLSKDFDHPRTHQLLPDGVSKPRVAIEDTILRVGFDYRIGPFSTVVQVAVHAWVPQNNLLCLELRGAWAGAAPLPTTQTRQVIEKIAEANDLDVAWKRRGHHLVALLKFPRTARGAVLQRVEIRDRGIEVAGRSDRLRYEPRTEG